MPSSAKTYEKTTYEDKRQSKQDKESSLYTSVCLGIISCIVLGLGILLVVFGVKNKLDDLLILGPIFICAGIGFIVMMAVVVCRPIIARRRNRVTPQRDTTTGYIANNEIITKDHVAKQRRPSAIQLYGEDKIIHVPSPVPLPTPTMPVPPMVYHPNDPREGHIPVIQLPISDKTKSALVPADDNPPPQMSYRTNGTGLDEISDKTMSAPLHATDISVPPPPMAYHTDNPGEEHLPVLHLPISNGSALLPADNIPPPQMLYRTDGTGQDISDKTMSASLPGTDIPPPPMVYHPNDPGEGHIPVIQLPISDKATSAPHWNDAPNS